MTMEPLWPVARIIRAPSAASPWTDWEISHAGLLAMLGRALAAIGAAE